MTKKKTIIATLFVCSSLSSFSASAEEMAVKVGQVDEKGMLLDVTAYCRPDAALHTIPGDNRNPEVSWSAGPSETKTYALIMHDPEVPTIFDDANKEGKIIPADMQRRDFYHWVMFNIPGDRLSVEQDIDSKDNILDATVGTSGFGKDARIGKSGYGGPCPPWNDEKMHKYYFTVYALDTKIEGSAETTAEDLLKKMQGHILESGQAMATYTQNPKLRN